MIPPRELMGKLGLRSGERLWLVNAPRELAEELAAGAEVEIVHEDDGYEGVIAYFESETEAGTMMTRIMAKMPVKGRLWVAGSTDAVAESGWTPGAEIDLGEGQTLRRFERA